MKTEERRLVQAAQRDPQQFDVLYKKYFQTIFNYFWYRLGHNKDVAEDLAQETFVRAFCSLPRFSIANASYMSYLLTIAHNLLVNHYRTTQPLPLEAVSDLPVEIWEDIEQEDQVRRLWHQIQRLTPIERD